MNNILNIIKDKTLTYEQKMLSLARAAEESLNVLSINKEVEKYRYEGIICDLNEGHAPYRPRYVAPYYEKFIKRCSNLKTLLRKMDVKM